MERNVLSGGGGSGVGDIIEFASGIFAYNWRAHTHKTSPRTLARPVAYVERGRGWPRP